MDATRNGNAKRNDRLWWGVLATCVAVAASVTAFGMSQVLQNTQRSNLLSAELAGHAARIAALEENYRRIDTKLEKICDLLRPLP